jgi:hypothetical protein
VSGTADWSSKELSLVWKCVQVFEDVHMSSLSRDLTRGCRYERRREAQEWHKHSKAGTGVKRLESELEMQQLKD